MHLVMSMSYLVVLLLPSARTSASMVMAWGREEERKGRGECDQRRGVGGHHQGFILMSVELLLQTVTVSSCLGNKVHRHCSGE